MILRRSILLVISLITVALLAVQPALAAPPEVHLVQPGDTLSALAIRYGTSVAELVEANGIANPNLIYIGQRLVIHTSGDQPDVPAPVPAAAPTSITAPTSAGPGSILAEKRIVTYYGNPFSDRMGILGELTPEQLVTRVRQTARLYEEADGVPVVPAIHFIATVAQAGPGADGMYRARMPMSVIEEYSRLAAANDMLLILDIQNGRSTIQAELAPYVSLLEQPHVHLALDPEFNMWGSQLAGVHLGHMTAAEINYASDLLADIVTRTGGPNKILIVHQFARSMLPDKQNIKTNPLVDLAVVMDGFGGRAIKLLHYRYYVTDELIQFGGIKMFYQQDTDLLMPQDVVVLDPPPMVVIYQ